MNDGGGSIIADLRKSLSSRAKLLVHSQPAAGDRQK